MSLSTLVNRINMELIKISRWLIINKISLNVKKTNFILSTGKKKNIDNMSAIKIDNTIIEWVANTQLLGIAINESLTWSDHIKKVCNKVNKSINIIYRFRKILPSRILINLYFAIVHPHFVYCNIVWASLHSTVLQNLFMKQKKAMCLITNSPGNSHSAPIFAKLNILSLFNINKLQTGCFMYNVSRGLLPLNFANIFRMNNDVHSHNTRLRDHSHVI